MNPTPELLAALEVFAPEYMYAIRNRDSWAEKARKGDHPGRGFCLDQAEKWNSKAALLLEQAN